MQKKLLLFTVLTLSSLVSFLQVLIVAAPTTAQTSCSDTQCQGNYHEEDFWITIASDNGINGRLSTETNPGLRSGTILPKGARYHCIGWQYGDKVKALGLDSYDARWYLSRTA